VLLSLIQCMSAFHSTFTANAECRSKSIREMND